MTAPTFSLALVHARHLPERAPLLDRLSRSLDLGRRGIPTAVIDIKGPYRIWARAAWDYCARAETSHALVLQDDALPCDPFWEVLTAAVTQANDHVISLNNAPLGAAAEAAASKGLRWCASPDGLIGHGYVMPVAAWKDLCAWRDDVLDPEAWASNGPETIGEDTILNLWAMHRGRTIWSPVPALVDHDPGPASTWGNPHPPDHLRATVPPRPGMDDINWDTGAVVARRVYAGNHRMLLTHLRSPDRLERLRRYYQIEGRR